MEKETERRYQEWLENELYDADLKKELEAIKGKANPTVQMIVAYSDSLDLSLKLSNYLTE